MRPFAFTRASEPKNATDSFVGDSQFIAGGTTLVDLMQLNVMRPDQLIDINKLNLKNIVESSDTVKIGALVSNTDLANSDLIKLEFPVLSQAILSGASPQLRNMATVGGNLLQKTRCYYFRDTAFPCNKREPGSGCPAMEGFNRVHAVLGVSEDCIASNPSDMNTALVMLDTVVNVTGAKGPRTMPITEFHVVPGKTPNIETVLQPGELIVGIEIQKNSLSRQSLYLKVRDRQSFSFALASAAVSFETQLGVIKSVRIALGGIATKPWRSEAAEQHLIGKNATTENFRIAADKALEKAQPKKHNKFKVELAKRTLVRALEQLGA